MSQNPPPVEMTDQLSELLAEVDDVASGPAARALNATVTLCDQALTGRGGNPLDRAQHLRRIAVCCDDLTTHLVRQAERAN